MNIRNCKLCGKIFNYLSGPIYCPACREGMEAKFQEVKEYIRDHKGATIPEVSEACDIDPAQIRQWLREDRLEVTEDSAITLNCEGCGASIRSGKYCDKCRAGMTQGFRDITKAARPQQPAAPAKDEKAGPKMRFLN